MKHFKLLAAVLIWTGCSFLSKSGEVLSQNIDHGLHREFGKRKDHQPITKRNAQTFWKTDKWMAAHKEEHIDPNAPSELSTEAVIAPRAVYMSYIFPDLSRRYIGEAPKLKHDTLLYRIGLEWEGVDGLMENITGETIREALWPDTTGIVDMENVEPLRKLAWIELSANLRGDEQGVHLGADIVYEGELGTNNVNGDTLFIEVVFNGLDTTLAIGLDSQVSLLELAALKLHAMRKKLEYELTAQYGEVFRVAWERVVSEEEENDDLRSPLIIKKLCINPNNPQLQFLQENVVSLKFQRDRKYVKEAVSAKRPRTP